MTDQTTGRDAITPDAVADAIASGADDFVKLGERFDVHYHDTRLHRTVRALMKEGRVRENAAGSARWHLLVDPRSGAGRITPTRTILVSEGDEMIRMLAETAGYARDALAGALAALCPAGSGHRFRRRKGEQSSWCLHCRYTEWGVKVQ